MYVFVYECGLGSSNLFHSYSGGSVSPSGRFGVRFRSRPSDQALRVLAANVNVV